MAQGRNMTEPGRNSFRPPGRRTEIEDGVQDGARFPDPRTEDGAVLRFRPPGRRAEIDDGGQDGGRFSEPGRNSLSPQIPSSRTEEGHGEDSVLRPPGRNIASAPSSRTGPGRSCPPPD
eukprot:gene11059-biopygen2950